MGGGTMRLGTIRACCAGTLASSGTREVRSGTGTAGVNPKYIERF